MDVSRGISILNGWHTLRDSLSRGTVSHTSFDYFGYITRAILPPHHSESILFRRYRLEVTTYRANVANILSTQYSSIRDFVGTGRTRTCVIIFFKTMPFEIARAKRRPAYVRFVNFLRRFSPPRAEKNKRQFVINRSRPLRNVFISITYFVYFCCLSYAAVLPNDVRVRYDFSCTRFNTVDFFPVYNVRTTRSFSVRPGKLANDYYSTDVFQLDRAIIIHIVACRR